MPLTDESRADWGGDESGLITGHLFDDGGRASPVDSREAARLLEKRRLDPVPADASFLWLHFNLAHVGARRWLERHAGLSEGFHEALGSSARSTRVERDGDSLVAVVNDMLFDFDFDASEISTLWVGLERHLVVTGRHQPLRSIDALRTHVRNGEAMRSPVALLERLLRAQAEVLIETVRRATVRTDEVEDQLLAARPSGNRARLGGLRRLLVRLQRLLAPEPASLFRLLQHPPAWVSAIDVQDLREVNEEFSVVLSDMASLQERIKLLQEEVAASVNESNGRSLFVLTVVTVLALPINILAGLFGMNVGGVPLAGDPHGFWVIVAIVIVFTLVACWLALRRKDD
ncbi:MAG TPA: transporter [Ramlibacter sp.]|nr:transporter [Ramlibacter sp.]